MITDNTGFDCYRIHHALQLHFKTKTYDFIKYGGKTSVTKEKFATRKDRFIFQKLSRRYSLDDITGFYLANILEGGNKWVGDLLQPDADNVYKSWLKTQQSLTYVFENEVSDLFEKVKKPNDLLSVTSGQYPLLLVDAMQKSVHMETVILMDGVLNFFSMWCKMIEDQYIWPEFRIKCEKYTPFINYDAEKIKNILKAKILNCV